MLTPTIAGLRLGIAGLVFEARGPDTELGFPPPEAAHARFRLDAPTVRAPTAPGVPRSGLPLASPPAASPRSGTSPVERRADVRWSVHQDGCERPLGETVFVHRGQWHVTRGEDPFVLPLRVPGGVPPAQQTTRRLALVARALDRVELHLDPAQEPARPINPFGYLLAEVYFLLRFTRHPGLLLHAAAVRDGRGGAWVFPGPSGAGKSTLARIWAEHGPAAPLSDESVLILPGPDGRLWAHGTPWHSRAQIADPGGAPLAGLAFLEHGPAARWRDLDPVAALARLLAQAQAPTWHREGLARTLDSIEALRRTVPVRVLEFRPDPTAIAHVLQG